MKVLFLILIIERISPYARKYSTDGWVSLLWGRQKNRHNIYGRGCMLKINIYGRGCMQHRGTRRQPKGRGDHLRGLGWQSRESCAEEVNSERSAEFSSHRKQRGPQWGARHGQGHNTVNSIKTGTGSWSPQDQALKQEHYRNSKNMCWIETKDRKSASQAF